MTEEENTVDLRLDRPLRLGEALVGDLLDRGGFVAQVSKVLQRISPEAGLVVSIEGAWGSGKTSLLAMLEELLNADPGKQRAVVVHFNPWLVGDRDALLRQFLASIAKAVKLTDHAKAGKQVAKELKTYSKAFDVLKLIPGAEPWASIIKSAVESVGNASEAVFDYNEVPPINSATGNLVKSVFEKENGLEEAVFRRADHRFLAAGRGRRSDQGTMPATRLQ